jgi:putative ABC transport system permease protein
LVLFQFASSIILIIGTFVIWNQLNYIRNKDLGYNRNQVLIIENTYPLGKQVKSFKDDMLKLPGVESATMTGYLPTGPYRSDNPFFTDAALSQDKAVDMQTWTVDENYIPTLDIKLLQGRNFSPQFPTDSNAIIINEAAAKQLGFNDPVNQTLYYLSDLQKKTVTTYHIIGVISDFNFNSLREQVTPMALGYGNQKGSIALRITTSDIPQLISQIQNEWARMVPAQPFSYSFMDDDFNAIYKSEQRIGKIFVSFAILAIFIACLGLFGLAAYAAEQRTKEIGIRKVLGASVSNIVNMLSIDFLKLVGIASLISFPVAWWLMNQWLQSYAYRISIGFEVFVFAGIIAAIIAIITVSFQAVKAAIANPVKSLRTE